MMFSTTLSSIIDITQGLVFTPTETLISAVMNCEDVYPGDFSKPSNKQLSQELYQTRIQLWKDSETDDPKDEVLDNVLNKHSDAAKTLQALFKAKQVRKNVAFQHRKQFHLDEALKRRAQRLLGEQQMQDKLSLLQEENAKLKQELLDTKTSSYTTNVKSHIEEILHVRQIHHLRSRGSKLISKV